MGWGVCHLPKGFSSKNRRGLGLYASEDSLELCPSQTGLAKNEKLHQTTSS